MKKIFAGLCSVCLLVTVAAALEGGIDRENLSIKAGPTEAGEALSLVWVEALVYPSVVKDERVISLGVRTAAPVKTVKAVFDFQNGPVALASNDGQSWSTAFRIPNGVKEGVHVARYQISGRRGSIQRTVEFFVNKAAAKTAAADVSQGEAFLSAGWPLTVTGTCTAYAPDFNRILYTGQVVTSISKMPWYKVVFDDGKEGWISAVNVKEPTDDYCRLGAEAYKARNFAAAVQNYQNAIAVDPAYAAAYLGLARSRVALGDRDSAADALQKALRLDERNMEIRVAASDLSQDYLQTGRQRIRAKRWHEAIAALRRAVELRPAAVEAWLAMGESLAALGLDQEARDAWREGLRQDPDNGRLRALLGGETALAAAPARKRPAGLAAKAPTGVAPLVADDSLQILKSGKTNKGTRIDAAVKSVVTLTKSLGTPIVEKGWQVRKQGERFLVSFLCEQSGGALESFDWLVDVDTRRVLPHNDNARLLMSRW
ncbi:MAG: tetratricopeptide repeat protein [Candidatus Margulisiibacteriota bacterium]